MNNETQYLIVISLMGMAVVVLVGLILSLWPNRRNVGIKVFTLLELALLEWTIANAFELLAPDLAAKLIWSNIQYLGIVLVPVFWFIFALQYARRERWVTRRHILLLVVIPTVTNILIWTNNAHGLMAFNIHLDTGEPFSVIVKNYGGWFWIHTAYSYLLMLGGTIILLRALGRASDLYRIQRNIFLVGILVPWFANVLFVFRLVPSRLDILVPVIFAVSGVAIGIGLARFRMFELIPIARDAVVESMNDGVLVIDLNDRVADVNRSALRLTETPHADPIGKPIFQMWHTWEEISERIRQAQVQDMEITLTHDGQRQFLNVSITPLRNLRQQMIGQLIVLRDVTRQMQAEQALRQAHDELEVRVAQRTAELAHANSELRTEIAERQRAQADREKLITELESKNAELERFTYTVSHDLKSPLITIRGFLGLVEKDALAGDFDNLKVDSAHIIDATDKMQHLVNELLELSRAGRMMNNPETVAFENIIREAVNLVAGQIAAHHVQMEIELGLPTVYGDRTRLIQVLQNLIDNAIKFMGDQPRPHIDIGMRGTDADGKPIFFVQDNGIGIGDQYHDSVFGLFTKMDAHSEGTGIGLALVKRIIQVHGGRIWVESEGLGKGSTFCFTLPSAPSTSKIREQG